MEGFDFRAILQILSRRKWVIIIPLLVSSAIGAYLLKTAVPIYHSKATIMLGKVFTLTDGMTRMLPGVTAQNRVRLRDNRETILKELNNRKILEKVLKRVGKKPSPKVIEKAKELVKKNPDLPLDQAILSLQIASLTKSLTLDFPRRGEYFEIGAKSKSAKEAYLITSALADLFIEQNLLQEISRLQGTASFASEQMQFYAKKLQEAEAKLRDFKRSAAQVTTQDQPVNTENLTHVQKLIKTLELEKSEKIDDLSFIDSQLKGLVSEIKLKKTRKATRLRAQLIEKMSKYAELMITHTWNSGEVIRLNDEIVALKEQLSNEIKVNGARDLVATFTPREIELATQREIIQTEIDLINQQIKTLSNLIRLFKDRQTEIPMQDIQLAKLQADVEKYRELHRTFQDQVNSAKVREAMQRTEIKIRYQIIDPAQIPVAPLSSDSMKTIIVVIFGGLGFGAALTWALEFMDNSYKSIDDVEESLGLAVLGIVPKLSVAEPQKKKRKWAFPVVAFSVVVVIAVVIVIMK